MESPSTPAGFPASVTNIKTSRSGRRNRRRAKDLTDRKILEIKQDFEVHRNTLEVAQNHLLPRSEAVDAVLIRVTDDLHSVRSELAALRVQFGIDAPPARPFLVRRAA